jgi:hypothetical protein
MTETAAMTTTITIITTSIASLIAAVAMSTRASLPSADHVIRVVNGFEPIF